VAGALVAATAAVAAAAVELIQVFVLFVVQFQLARLVDVQCVHIRRQNAYSNALLRQRLFSPWQAF
jgi:hypothetical protein